MTRTKAKAKMRKNKENKRKRMNKDAFSAFSVCVSFEFNNIGNCWKEKERNKDLCKKTINFFFTLPRLFFLDTHFFI